MAEITATTVSCIYLFVGLVVVLAEAHSTLGTRKNVVIVSRQLKEDLANRAMNISGAVLFSSVPKQDGPLPTEFELFDPPNLYLYHDYVSQGLPKFMTDVELSTGTQRVIFILHWSVRYFLVILLVLGMLQ